MTDVLSEGPLSAPIRLLLAHGAGAPMTSPFMEKIAGLLVERGLGVSRFEFAYMAGRREDGKRRPPPKAERLVDEYKAAVTAVREKLKPGVKLLIGGKSMGGRVASLVADELYRREADLRPRLPRLSLPSAGQAGGAAHRPPRASALPGAHRAGRARSVREPRRGRGPEALARDRFAWAGDGDHDLGPRGGSGFTRAGNLAAAADAIAAFATALPKSK